MLVISEEKTVFSEACLQFSLTAGSIKQETNM